MSDEVRQNARILQETLQSFNIDAKILNASQGPAVTRYELEPAAGVKVSKIVHLADDLALKLAATDIRIDATIPGKAAVGIEVPNKKLSGVMLRDVLDTDASGWLPAAVPSAGQGHCRKPGHRRLDEDASSSRRRLDGLGQERMHQYLHCQHLV